jgi:hypothetical protein
MGDGFLPTDLQWLPNELRKLADRLDKLEQPDAQQLFRAKEKVEALIDSLPALVTAYLASGFTTGSMTSTGNVTVGGNVSASGTVTATAGLTSLGVGATDVTLLPGTRYQTWVNVPTGIIGQTASTITKKTNLAPVPYTAAQFLSVMALVFEYIGQVDIRDNPSNPNYDPHYIVPLEIGLVAEHLIEAGLSLYVQFNEAGEPMNIDYATFGAHAALVIGRDHETRIAALEAAMA